MHLEGNKYKLETDFNYRVGFDDSMKCTFIDPAGGPFMYPGYEIEGREIKAIHDEAIIEFEDGISSDKAT